MGWASGSELAEALIKSLCENVGDPDKRRYIYDDVIPVMLDMDWDTVDDVMGMDPEFDECVRAQVPHWFEDEEE